MGLLVIHNDLIKNEPDVIQAAFNWMTKECKAEIKEVTQLYFVYDQQRYYSVEGDNIPAGQQRFDLRCEIIVEGVVAFNIE